MANKPNTNIMDRRDFIKKTAMTVAGTAVTAPVMAMLTQNEGTAELLENESEPISNNQSDKKMKVLMVNGSPRHDGNTFTCLEEVGKQLQKHGIETEILQIGNGPVSMCVNCGGCRRNGCSGCVFDDDLCNVLADKMKTADALIVGSPVYYGQPNGGVLAVMQRLFYSSGHIVKDKPAAAIAVCRRGGATATLQTLNMMFEMMNMPVVTSQYWNIAYGAGKGEVKLDTEGMQTMRTLGNNMAWLLEKIHAGGKTTPERERGVYMNFIR